MTLAPGKEETSDTVTYGGKKMKRYRNIEQIKEQGRNSKDQINKRK